MQGYQVFTQACGMLEMVEPRDAFLGTLCEFALANPGAELETSSPGGAGRVGWGFRGGSRRAARALGG